MYNVGEVISIPVYDFVDHWGVYVGNGFVISNSKRKNGVVLQTVQDFSEGKNIRRIGYLGALSPFLVVENAYSLLGRDWDLFDNCQHFAHIVHGMKPKSYQLRLAFAGAVLLAGVCFMRTNRR